MKVGLLGFTELTYSINEKFKSSFLEERAVTPSSKKLHTPQQE